MYKSLDRYVKSTHLSSETMSREYSSSFNVAANHILGLKILGYTHLIHHVDFGRKC